MNKINIHILRVYCVTLILILIDKKESEVDIKVLIDDEHCNMEVVETNPSDETKAEEGKYLSASDI